MKSRPPQLESTPTSCNWRKPKCSNEDPVKKKWNKSSPKRERGLERWDRMIKLVLPHGFTLERSMLSTVLEKLYTHLKICIKRVLQNSTFILDKNLWETEGGFLILIKGILSYTIFNTEKLNCLPLRSRRGKEGCSVSPHYTRCNNTTKISRIHADWKERKLSSFTNNMVMHRENPKGVARSF